MAPVARWISGSLALLPSATTLATAPDDEYDDDDALPSREAHRLRRDAMLATIASSDFFDITFPSPREKRSYYYFHAGLEVAAAHAAAMSGGGDAEELDAKRLEGAIEAELARVRKRLGELGEVDAGESSQEEGEKGETKEEGEEVEAKEEGGEREAKEEEYTPEERLQLIHAGARSYFQCDGRADIAPSELGGKFDELRELFWKLAGVENPPSGKYEPNPDLYVDFVADGDYNATRQEMGLFAARDFEKGEAVYSRKVNALYFQDVNMYVDLLHSLNSLPGGASNACLALKVSSMKRIANPGRILVELALGEVGLMRRQNFANLSNVLPKNEKGLRYVASRDIRKGEEIVDGAPAAAEVEYEEEEEVVEGDPAAAEVEYEEEEEVVEGDPAAAEAGSEVVEEVVEGGPAAAEAEPEKAEEVVEGGPAAAEAESEE